LKLLKLFRQPDEKSGCISTSGLNEISGFKIKILFTLLLCYENYKKCKINLTIGIMFHYYYIVRIILIMFLISGFYNKILISKFLAAILQHHPAGGFQCLRFISSCFCPV